MTVQKASHTEYRNVMRQNRVYSCETPEGE